MKVRLVSPGSKLTVDPGDQIRVNVQFGYRGPAWRETLYSALYVRQWWGIDEVSDGAGASSVDIPETPEKVNIAAYVLVPVPNRPGETFGIYAKLGNIPSNYWDNVIEVSEEAPPPSPEVKDLQILSLPKSSWMGAVFNFSVMFKYRGPTVTRQLYAAIGNKNTWFNEIITGIKSIPISGSTTWATRLGSVKVEINPPITPGIYDLYAKINGEMSPIYEDAITITP